MVMRFVALILIENRLEFAYNHNNDCDIIIHTTTNCCNLFNTFPFYTLQYLSVYTTMMMMMLIWW